LINSMSSHDSSPTFIRSANSVTGEIPQNMREPGVNRIVRNMPFIQDIVPIGFTNGRIIEWVEQNVRDDNSAMVAEGGTIPKSDITWKTANTRVKKLADLMKVGDESWEDIEFIKSEIQTELMMNIELLLNTQILTGDNTGENLKGIDQVATTWNAPGDFTISPANSANNWDVLIAGIAQIREANFEPNWIYIHPRSLMELQLTKDTDENYMFPTAMFAAGGMMVDGIPIVANNSVAIDAFTILDINRTKLFLRRDLTINIFDQNATDAQEGLLTITATKRVAFRVKGNDTGAIVDGTFAQGIIDLNAGS